MKPGVNTEDSAPIGAIPMALIFFVWPADEHPKKLAERPKLRDLDFFGAALMILGSVSLVVGLQQAGARIWTWGSPTTIAMLVIGGTSWLVLLCWEYLLFAQKRWSSVHPQFPFALLKHRVMAFTML